MQVTLIRLGHSTSNANLEGIPTVQDLLDHFNVDPTGQSILMNGAAVNLEATLAEGTVISLAPKVTGG